MKLTEDYVRSLTYPEYFERGVRYYKDGLVEIVTNNEDVVKANVYGSKKYKIIIDKNDLECECDCPAYSYKHNCKHVVAVMLFLINKKTVSKKCVIRRKVDKKISKRKKQAIGTKFDKVAGITGQIKTLVRSQERYRGNWKHYVDE